MITPRRALLVLGMHRSGTSALTRLLNLYGASLPADLLPANAGNVRGYWEPSSVVAFHDTVLASVGSRWDDSRELPAEWFRSPEALRAAGELAALVTAEFDSAPLIVVKDPRLCRLVPLWRAALASLEIEPMAVLLVRHPFEVESSLRRRDGRPEGAGLLLWLQHVLSAEADSRGLPRLVVTYDQLLADHAEVARRIESDLGIMWPARTEEADAAARAFVDPALRHERRDQAAGQPLPPMIGEVYAWFESASRAGIADPSPLDAVRREVRRWEELFGPEIGWRLGQEQHWIDQFHEQVKHHAATAAGLEASQQACAGLENARRAAEEQLDNERRQWLDRQTRLETELAECRSIERTLHAELAELKTSPLYKLRGWIRGSPPQS